MANINAVIVEGNLVQSASLSHWNDNTAYCRFTIANNEYYKNQKGEYESIPSFIDCQCKGPYAEAMAKHLLKGRRITVSGRLKQNRWTDEGGQKHSAIVVKVAEISLSPFGNNSFRPNEEGQRHEERRLEAEEFSQSAEDFYDDSMFDNSDEIPF